MQRLQDTIEGDTRLWLLFNTMFNQIPDEKQFLTTGEGLPQPNNYTAMSAAINRTISSGVASSQNAEKNGLTGQPLEALLSYPLGTVSGFAAFQDPQVNSMFKPMLDAWGSYLQSPESRSVLNIEDGWLSPPALKLLEQTANENAGTNLTFPRSSSVIPQQNTTASPRGTRSLPAASLTGSGPSQLLAMTL